MALNISKLQNVKKSVDGKIIARCPACQAAGADEKGEHLVVYADGKYGCVSYAKDKSHNKQIFELVGEKTAFVPERITVKTLKVPESKTIMDLGKFSRFARPIKETPFVVPVKVEVEQKSSIISSSQPKGDYIPDASAARVEPEGFNPVCRGYTQDQVEEFLNSKAA